VTAFLLYLVSLRDYGAGDSGPIAELVKESFLFALVRANAKMALLLTLAGAVHGLVAGIVVAAIATLREKPAILWRATVAGSLGFVIELVLALARAFLESPGSVATLCPYDNSRFDPLFDYVSPRLVQDLSVGLFATAGLIVLAAIAKRLLAGRVSLRTPTPLLEPARGYLVAPASVGAVALTALVVAPPAGARPVRTDARPNVLILMSESLRADRIGAVRDGIPVSPNVDRLAARGTSFENCFVPVARTTEATVALMTGTWPQSHGVRTAWVGPEQHALPVPALPGIFHDAGYETFGTGDWNSSDFGRFSFGFDRTDVPGETWSLKAMVSRGGRGTAFLVRLFYGNALGAWLVPEVFFYPGAHSGEAVTRKVVAELERVAERGRPSLVVGFYGTTHAPFPAKGEHLRRFCDPAYRGPNRYCLMARSIDDAVALQGKTMRALDLLQVQGVYDAAVRTFDDEVGAVTSELERLGLADDTIVVVTGDHGTAFYERGSFGQGNEVASDAANKVPLVVFDPRSASRGARRVAHVVRSIDVVPTLCALANVAAPPTLEGTSLVPQTEDPARDPGLIAYAETGLWISRQPWQSEELDFGFPSIYEMAELREREEGFVATKPFYVKLMIRAQHRMVRDDRWKLLYVPTRGQPLVKLYDANETAGRDVASEHPDVVARLKATLETFLAREPRDVFTMELPRPRSR
jgi:arylsulfatase A-like enzyme